MKLSAMTLKGEARGGHTVIFPYHHRVGKTLHGSEAQQS